LADRVTSTPRSVLAGDLPLFAADPLGFLERAARNDGPVAHLRFGRSRAVLLSDPALIEEVLTGKREDFVKARPLLALRRLFGRGLLTNEGEPWKRQRRLAQPAFQPRALIGHSRTVITRTGTLLDTWKTGSTFDVHHEMKKLLMLIIAEALFGADASERAAAIGMALESTMDHYSSRRGLARFSPDWFPLAANRSYVKGVNELEQFVNETVAARRGNGTAHHDLLAMLLAARDERGLPMPAKQLRDEAITLFVGGFDTPALALSWSWYLVSSNPAVAQRLRDEVDTCLGRRDPGFEDLRQLRFAEAIIKEAMRLYPPAWIVSREAARDTTIGGHAIRRGTSVMMSQWVVHRDDRFFPNPQSFDPDRWLSDARQELPRFAYFPFGGGPRVCIGASFAMMETTLILAMLAQRFELNVIDSAAVEPRATMTLRPRRGVPARVVRR
jgi:cytochrome P450